MMQKLYCDNWHSYVNGNPVNNTDPSGYYKFVNTEHPRLIGGGLAGLTVVDMGVNPQHSIVEEDVLAFHRAQTKLLGALNEIIPEYEKRKKTNCIFDNIHEGKLKLLKAFRAKLKSSEKVKVSGTRHSIFGGGFTNIFGEISLYEYNEDSAAQLITHESAHALGSKLNFIGWNIRNEAFGSETELTPLGNRQRELREDRSFPYTAYEFEAWLKGLIDSKTKSKGKNFPGNSSWGYGG